jgi:hypothetical protein
VLVEDEPYMADAICDGLRLEAIAADIAGDGDSALELLSLNAHASPSSAREYPRSAAHRRDAAVLALPHPPRSDDRQPARAVRRDDRSLAAFEPEGTSEHATAGATHRARALAERADAAMHETREAAGRTIRSAANRCSVRTRPRPAFAGRPRGRSVRQGPPSPAAPLATVRSTRAQAGSAAPSSPTRGRSPR